MYLETYHASTFTLAWSEDHRKVIEKTQQAILFGGRFAHAMPRGSGKTSIAECSALWAVLYCHRPFVPIIGSDAPHAEQMMESIKTEIENNELLGQDFPEVCYPVRSLEGINNRASGQTSEGVNTNIVWTQDVIVLPTIEGARTSGNIIKTAGLTSGIRGMKHKRTTPEGPTSIRPSLVIIDDPQSDESSASPTQCDKRERILSGAILGLAGPGQSMSAIMPCTVINGGDLADRFLNRALHPDWNGERTKLIYSFPANVKLWDKYSEVRAEGLRAEKGMAPATEFYRAHQAEMDEGAVVAWPERFKEDEASAIQHAMNLKLQDAIAFAAEYQNEPLPLEEEIGALNPEQIANKINRLERGIVQVGTAHLVGMIDVHGELLYYCIMGVDDGFSGAIVDYGTHPDQGRAYFSLRDARPKLSSLTPGTGTEGVVYAGLNALTDSLLDREWRREDGGSAKIKRLLIDANWAQTTDTVYQFCRQSRHAALLLPSHGKGVTAASTPLSQWNSPSLRTGTEWRITQSRQRAIGFVNFDSNYWKSFMRERMASLLGSKGSVSLFGDTPNRHRLFADHLAAEYPVRTEARGRKIDEWKIKVGRDNHWLDCLVGCCVGASIEGAKLNKMADRPKKTIRQLQEEARGRRG